MQRTRRTGFRALLLGLAMLAPLLGGHPASGQVAAPAAPSYAAVVRAIDSIRAGWEKSAPVEAGGWNTYFDALRSELAAYAAAKTSNDQLGPLNRVYRLSSGLDGLAWEPAVELREALREWLRPRVRMAWAERRLTEALAGVPESAPTRKEWTAFVDDKLGGALRSFEAAKTVQARRAAISRLHGALESLRKTNPWTYSSELQAAADDLFNRPNLDVSADVASLYPVLSAQVVTTGPIYRGGYVSQVTAGPYAGFGLATSDEGIAFTNSQYLFAYTPITDFQQQLLSDRRGRLPARLYQFQAASTDQGLMTITAVLTPLGVQLSPFPGHNIDLLLDSFPIPGHGKGLMRGVIGLLGFNQNRIERLVYQGAIGRVIEGVIQNSADEARERADAAQNDQNSKLRQVLRGDGNATIKDISIKGLSLRSRPENALIGGTVTWLNGPVQTGAELPQPPKFAAPASGISADIHLASVANNLAGGYFSSPETSDVKNLMIEVRKPVPGLKPADAVKITKNVDFATFIGKVNEIDAGKGENSQVIRVTKPGRAPEFGVDARGFLVAIVHDLVLDVPVPPQLASSPLAGAKAKIYRLQARTAEFVFEIKPVTEPDGTIRMTGGLKEFTPEPGSRVLAINEDEAKALPLDPFRATFVYQGFAQAIRAKPLNAPLENLKLKGYKITSVSDLDPSGWLRIVLTPTGERPLGQ
jgi:hypothetical protein